MDQDQDIIISALRFSDSIRCRFADLLRPYHITLQQFNVLRILRGALPDPLPVLTISSRMVEHCPGMTRMLNRIGDKGFIERKRCTRDRRIIYCHITPSGLELLRHLDQPVLDQEQQTLSGLSDQHKAALQTIFSQLNAQFTPTDT